MKLELYKINAFTDSFNGGNPAGVIPLDHWLPDEQMQAIAKENNYSETAFCIQNDNDYDLRWFTPGCEVDLCGHATVAAAFVLSTIKEVDQPSYVFNTRSGRLIVTKTGEQLTLDMPANALTETSCPPCIFEGIGVTPTASYKTDDYMIVIEDEEFLENLRPNYSALKKIDARGTIVTAPSQKPGVDFVSRWFGGPDVGIDEDPVTGSAHATLVPYWSERLNKQSLQAVQCSQRKGVLACNNDGDRVQVSGGAILYFSGHIFI